ncbi:hypothetical protein FRB96_003814 [Tulasnella sp. 330]|nr:hypothetical protein FRB96_003814 [Tulasnella sp. 330]KAG8883146.1 hypothetical protein FRB97_007081 [Tulasnella sp. 331]KAG8888450.1 hypothetical protein FRB98_007579 [Tulasnella sp. 332]
MSQYQNQETHDEAKVSHELIAGAASFAAMKAWDKHQEMNGKPPSHDKAKELIAGFVGAFVDREVESKGRDRYDEYKAKKQAKELAEAQIATQY